MTASSEVSLKLDAETFATYSDSLQAAALATTRLAAAHLPADLPFHRSVDPALARDVDALSDRVLAMVSRLARIASETTSRIRDEEDIVDEFVRNIVDPMEGMLESTDGALDVFLGKKKEPAIHVPVVPVDSQQKKTKKQPFHGRLDPALTHASHMPKPQSLFKHAQPNTDESPYIPATLIPHKWCAKVPLGYVFHDERPNQGIEGVHEDDEEERRRSMLHPYYYELTHPSYPDHVFDPPSDPSLPPPFDNSLSGALTTSSPLTFISTPKALLSMANIISSATELAVDLEHHSYRSYRGFLALMQISTRQGDFLIDLLVPEVREGLRQAKGKRVGESEEAHMANEAGEIIAKVFADPSVIKVFHGAESDIVWLQQDFNIFVVGLFDTFHASKLLEFPKHSLAYLLETYCDFIPDKRYQLADWRIRPLPTEMLAYARSDTHFLLYIYDTLRLLLIKRSSTVPTISGETRPVASTKQTRHHRTLIYDVLTRSCRTALRLYEVEAYDAEGGTGSGGWGTLARKWNKIELMGMASQMRGMGVQESQAAVYKAVHRWREDIARGEDESTRYVLPTHHLFRLAERVPMSVPDLLSLFSGLGGVSGNIPPGLKRHTGELVMVIKNSMEATESFARPQQLANDGHEGSKVTILTVVGESEAMSSTASLSTAAKPTNESRLWAIAPSPIPSVSRSSSLSSGTTGERAQERGAASSSSVGREEAYFATRSVLFGTAFAETPTVSSSGTTRSTFAHAQVSSDFAERFKHLTEKIHKTLVITPVMSIPSLTSSVKTQASEASLSGTSINVEVDQNNCALLETLDPMPPGPEAQTEIPFVPAHKRQFLSNSQVNEIKDDTIVVVGQVGARQRKRKRDKARNIALTPQPKFEVRSCGVGPSASTGDHDQEMEQFDYSSVPNLLDSKSKRGDAQAVQEEDERRTKKQRHGKGMLTSSSNRRSGGKSADAIRYASCMESALSSPSHETTTVIQGYTPGAMEDNIDELLVLQTVPLLPVTKTCFRIWL